MQNSAPEKVAVSTTLKISDYKSRDIPSSKAVSPPPSICEKANSRNVQNALMPLKTLEDAFFFEKFNTLKKDYEPKTRITKDMASLGEL